MKRSILATAAGLVVFATSAMAQVEQPHQITAQGTALITKDSDNGPLSHGATKSGGMYAKPSPPIRVPAAGAMQLTLMPCGAPAVARLRASPITAALAAAYETLSGRPNMPVEVVMTTRP